MIYRKPTFDDVETIYQMVYDYAQEGAMLARSRNALYETLRDMVVAEEDGRIVGVILAGHDGRRGYIYHMSVAEDRRHRGIGRELVSRSLSALKAEGINKVALLVFHRNEVGNAFWESQGFTVREDVAYRNKLLTELVRIDT